MADTKISALTAATTPLAGTEVLPIVQSGVTKKVAVSDLTAGRAVAMGTASSVGSGSGVAELKINGGASSPVNLSFQAAGVDQWLLGKGSASANNNFELYNTAGVIAMIINKTSNNVTFNGTQVNINGASNSLVNFQQGGVDKWLIGNGAASVNGNFEIYNTAGVVSLSIDKTTNNQTFSGGNLVQGTAAKGINFTANSAAAGMTSQLLNWYEEGTWTPTVTSSNGALTSYTSAGNYTRVGRICTATFKITITNNGTGSGYINITLPFTHANTPQVAVGSGEEVYNSGSMLMIRCNQNSNIAYVYFYNYTYPVATNSVIIGTVSYQV